MLSFVFLILFLYIVFSKFANVILSCFKLDFRKVDTFIENQF
nr:MAG TPA: hypothetical protein [Caudoviricetes sp.]